MFSKESDVWSLGCVFYYLLTLTPPFDGESTQIDFYKKIYKKQFLI
jgi:serine/threonine protein kinase